MDFSQKKDVFEKSAYLNTRFESIKSGHFLEKSVYFRFFDVSDIFCLWDSELKSI